MKTKAIYSQSKRELSLKVENKQMTFDLMALPFKDVFEFKGSIWEIEVDVRGRLWIGHDDCMQQYELNIQE